MIKIGDDYYYANSKGQLIVNQTYYCSRMNGLMEEGTYAFDAKGKLIPGATDKNGIALPNIERDYLTSPIRNRRFQQGEHDRADDSGNRQQPIRRMGIRLWPP